MATPSNSLRDIAVHVVVVVGVVVVVVVVVPRGHQVVPNKNSLP